MIRLQGLIFQSKDINATLGRDKELSPHIQEGVRIRNKESGIKSYV